MLTRDQILDCDDNPGEEVDVPEWGGSVLVRGMTGTERDRFELGMVVHKDNIEALAGLRGKVVSWCTLGEDHKQLFTAADIDRLGRKSGRAMDRVYSVALRLSGVNEKATAKAEADLTAGQNGASTSVWPDTSVALSASS